MNIYADEEFYKGEYLCGRAAVITAAYPYYFREASRIIDRYTFGSIGGLDGDSIPEEVKMCCCELAEMHFTETTSQAARSVGIASESVQGWSVTYESKTARSEALSAAQGECVKKWLGGMGLLYSGVRGC